MTGTIIFLIAAGYFLPGLWLRITLLHTDRGLRPGLRSAIATVVLWPVVWAAECAHHIREN